MKKLFFTAIIAGVAIMFTSCKKNYICTCTETVDGVRTVVGTELIHGTKSKAQSICTPMYIAYGGKAVSCAI